LRERRKVPETVQRGRVVVRQEVGADQAHISHAVSHARRHFSSRRGRVADVVAVTQHKHRLNRPGAVIIATVAAIDVAYRLLLRAPVRRMLGMRSEV
jgi:hypothetical protein